MKRKLLLSMTAAMVLSSSLTVCAAPQYMADGAVFDPEWYLEQNPDVAANWSLGTSADALYEHYVRHGAGEGRKPFNAAALDQNNIQPYQSNTTPAPDNTASEETTNNVVLAVEGQTYCFPGNHTRNYNYADCTVNVTFEKVAFDGDGMFFSEYLAPYTLPGYEWRQVHVMATTDAAVVTDSSLAAIDSSKADFCRLQVCDYDGDLTDFNGLWDYVDDNGWVLHAGTFTTHQDGKEYSGCQLFEIWGYGTNDYSNFQWYALVPQGFNGKLSVGYASTKYENGQVVVNESVPYTLFNF